MLFLLSSKLRYSSVISLVMMCVCYAHQSVAKEYIVKLRQSLEREYADPSIEVMDEHRGLNLVKVKLLDHNPENDEFSRLREYFEAEYVVENVPLHAYFAPSDPRVSEQWALETVNAFAAWDISMGSHNVVVAVIDTGMDLNHLDLRDNLWTNANETPGDNIDNDNNGYIDDIHGWDFHGNDKHATDETSDRNPGHGTHCSGIIGAVCGNDVGICGMSPTVSLMPLRFLGSDGSGDLFAATKAIEYAASNGAHVISASWGATIQESGAQPLIEAIKQAEEKGVIFVAAAGNDGHSNDTASTYPANAQTPHMISVAASNSSDGKPQWSNYGRKVDLAAPGENILSTIPGGHQNLSGTSMATPMVSGLVALMKSVDITLTGKEARSILQSTGHDVSIETASGRRIDAHKAMSAVAHRNLTVVPAAATIKPGDQYDFSAWGGRAPYRFESLNADVATVDESGHLVAVKEGDVTVRVIDADNNMASSVSVKVMNASQGGGQCPFPDQLMCMILCGISPDLPWCANMPVPELPFP